MQIKCGTDIIEIERVKEAIESLEEKFLNKVYTKNEIEYCESKKAQKYQHYAGKFAAKEAIFKAISNNLQSKYEISWTDIEILNDENMRPYVNLNLDVNIKDIDVSISHCKKYATATCIITK